MSSRQWRLKPRWLYHVSTRPRALRAAANAIDATTPTIVPRAINRQSVANASPWNADGYMPGFNRNTSAAQKPKASTGPATSEANGIHHRDLLDRDFIV